MKGLVIAFLGVLLASDARAQDALGRIGGSIGDDPHPASTPSIFDHPPTHEVSRPVVLTTAPIPSFATVEDARRAATQKFPDLAVAASQFNLKFVALYQRYQTEQPNYFNDPSWPLRLANEVAASSSLHPSAALAQESDAASFLGLTESEVCSRLGQPAHKKTRQSPDGPFKMLEYGGAPKRETFFVIFTSDGTVSSGQYQGVALRSH